jgi:phenylacetate 2-hydroxylase
MIKRGTDKPCISSAILKDQETKLTGVEVSSICLSLVSGGFETIPGTLTSCIGSLCTPEGLAFQDRAFDDIQRHYPGGTRDLWLDSFKDEKVPYVNAIVKEAARYYTVSSMSLPRKTIAPVEWDNGAIIPAGTMILVNAQAANHSVDHFGPDAGTFNPERWLTDDSAAPSAHGSGTNAPMKPPEEKPSQGIQHHSFGAGSRACSGQYIAQRLLYVALIRILSCYRIVASDEAPPNTDYVDYNQFKSALVAIPRDFKVRLVPRDGVDVEGILREAEERTRDYYHE